MTDFDSVKDTGSREQWDTGSRRDTREGKGRYDLIPPLFLRRLARHLENGARKYGDRNWELGQPLSRYLDSGMRHQVNILAGDVDEDHPAAVAWNAMAFLCTVEWIQQGRLPRSLDDIGYIEHLEDQIDRIHAKPEVNIDVDTQPLEEALRKILDRIDRTHARPEVEVDWRDPEPRSIARVEDSLRGLCESLDRDQRLHP